MNINDAIDSYLHNFPGGEENKAAEFLTYVEKILCGKECKKVSPETWHKFLDITADNRYIKALGSKELRIRWGEAAFKIIRLSEFYDLNKKKNQYFKGWLFITMMSTH